MKEWLDIPVQLSDVFPCVVYINLWFSQESGLEFGCLSPKERNVTTNNRHCISWYLCLSNIKGRGDPSTGVTSMTLNNDHHAGH